MLGLVAPGQDAADGLLLRLGGVEDRVEEEGDVGLALDLVVQEQVPELEAALGIVDGVVEAELLDQATLAPAGPAAVTVGADDVHFDLAAGVTAEAGPVVDEDDLRALAGGGDGGADPGHATAGDADVAREIHEREVRLGLEPAFERRGRSDLGEGR